MVSLLKGREPKSHHLPTTTTTTMGSSTANFVRANGSNAFFMFVLLLISGTITNMILFQNNSATSVSFVVVSSDNNPLSLPTNTDFDTTSSEEDTTTVSTTPKSKYPTNEYLQEGFLSDLPPSFFQALRDKIDHDDPYDRCKRYGFQYDPQLKPRRIFYGALIANEPWETFELTAAESFGLFDAMVFVESNRTQNFNPRNTTRLEHGPILAGIYGVQNTSRVQMRFYYNEDETLKELFRENDQRAQIIEGWKELGMQPEDLGFLADADETFSRDFYLALQTCSKIDLLDERHGGCKHRQTGIKSKTQVFESTPECPSAVWDVPYPRYWYHPDIHIGACIEGIANPNIHPPSPRDPGSKGGSIRLMGWGAWARENPWDIEESIPWPPTKEQLEKNKQLPPVDWMAIKDDAELLNKTLVERQMIPSYNAADLRQIGGAEMIGRNQPGYFDFTGYHFHNFFTNAAAIRHKHFTYGHPDGAAYEKSIMALNDGLSAVGRCVLGEDALSKEVYDRDPPMHEAIKNVAGGWDSLKSPRPIYLEDPIYRAKRHKAVTDYIRADEEAYLAREREKVEGPLREQREREERERKDKEERERRERRRKEREERDQREKEKRQRPRQ